MCISARPACKPPAPRRALSAQPRRGGLQPPLLPLDIRVASCAPQNYSASLELVGALISGSKALCSSTGYSCRAFRSWSFA
ncbi:hypothetical protein AV530_012709 [Patagioenas fasciata monilis]|uniref:Uncharacterized protein n=1 Tax=Patagioenas fasciata monilis TaxID=372326 RepID=A0A1V4JBN6_PATFA|nr:hypothetical protein AV530_012709 [Patagioenas fasciata monilis]